MTYFDIPLPLITMQAPSTDNLPRGYYSRRVQSDADAVVYEIIHMGAPGQFYKTIGEFSFSQPDPNRRPEIIVSINWRANKSQTSFMQKLVGECMFTNAGKRYLWIPF